MCTRPCCALFPPFPVRLRPPSGESKQAEAVKRATTSVCRPLCTSPTPHSRLTLNFCKTRQRAVWNLFVFHYYYFLFFFKLSPFAKLWVTAAKNSRHGFRHPQPPHLAENVNVHDDGKLWPCRLDFDEANCLSLPCHRRWSVYTENKPRTLDSNCVVG